MEEFFLIFFHFLLSTLVLQCFLSVFRCIPYFLFGMKDTGSGENKIAPEDNLTMSARAFIIRGTIVSRRSRGD